MRRKAVRSRRLTASSPMGILADNAAIQNNILQNIKIQDGMTTLTDPKNATSCTTLIAASAVLNTRRPLRCECRLAVNFGSLWSTFSTQPRSSQGTKRMQSTDPMRTSKASFSILSFCIFLGNLVNLWWVESWPVLAIFLFYGLH